MIEDYALEGLWPGGSILFYNMLRKPLSSIHSTLIVYQPTFFWPMIKDYELEGLWFQQDSVTCCTVEPILVLMIEKFPEGVVSAFDSVNCGPTSKGSNNNNTLLVS